MLQNDMKRFDQIFREQAERAFSTYNADQLADEGWNSFVSRRRGKKRFAIVLPFWAKAASIAVLVSAGGLFLYQTLQDQTENLSSLEQSGSKPDIETRIPVVSDQVRPEDYPLSEKSVIINQPVKLSAQKLVVAEAVIIKDTEVKNETISSARDSVDPVDKTTEEDIIAENNPDAEIVKEISVTDIADESPAGKKTSFIAGMSGMMSGIEDVTANSPGISVGFYVEHKLTGKLSVRPGLALAKHSYSSTNVSAGKVFMNSTTSTGNMTGSVASYENRLNMVTVEVPVNLVYTILERAKSSLFVSAGVSTMVYLDQNFSSSFTNVYTEQKLDLASGDVYEETRSQDVNVESDENAFSHIDYFGLANLSAGYSLPLKKGGNMLIEPFVQLPVSDLSSFNVRIRYGGLSFKFRFGQEAQQPGK
jgi:hypothetical protein